MRQAQQILATESSRMVSQPRDGGLEVRLCCLRQHPRARRVREMGVAAAGRNEVHGFEGQRRIHRCLAQ